MLGLDAGVHALSPDQLISAMLAAPVDLLWNGGVGTYVKATTQSHADAGDRANDAVRVDAPQVRAKVIAEGGNLGVTQAARIEYALAGGLVNTDFIDNSAGVDTSDHEVNIKILLAGQVSRGELAPADRNGLLQEMTDEVAALVLPRQLPPEPGPGRLPRAGAGDAARAQPDTAQDGPGRAAAPRAGRAARGQGDRRAPVRGPGPDRARVRGAARPGQDRRRAGDAGLGPAR